MSNPFEISNTLHRDGNSQAQRELTARQPSAAPADGRDVLDILSFLNAFAKEVNFYDLKDGVGDWTPFFQQSVPFRLAAIAQFDAEKWWNNFQKNRENGDVEAIMGQLFYAFVQHQQWHLGLHPPKLSLTEGNVLRQEWRVGSEEDNNPVRIVLKNLSDTNLRFLLLEYIGLFNTLKEKFQFPLIQNLEVFFSKEATTVWKFKPDNLAQPDAELKAKIGNKTTILPTLLPRLDRIAELIYKAQRAIGEVFTTENPDTLIFDNEEHEPHLGLLFAFLRLFKYAQGDMDNLTQRQLEFFYKDVLLFQARAAIPDKAHLVFELAKHIQGVHLLKQDTAYKDGKDNNKAEIIFSTDKETALNKATVAEVRTLLVENNVPYVFKQEGGDSGESFPIFGENDLIKNNLDSKSAKGRVGFVITSPVLKLQEGMRTVSVKIQRTEADISNLKDKIDVYYTSEEEWVLVKTSTISTVFTAPNIVLSFDIQPQDKPLLPMKKEALIKEKLDFSDPALKIVIKDTKLNGTLAGIVQNLQIEVKATLSSDVIVQNSDGIIDPKKAFPLFGVIPVNGSEFYFGSEELLNKKLKKLELVVDWDFPQGFNHNFSNYYNFYDLPRIISGTNYFTMSFSKLENKVWRAIGTPLAIFSNTNQRTFSLFDETNTSAYQEFKINTASLGFYTPDTVAGFFKLHLNQEFRHQSFQTILARQALAVAQYAQNTNNNDFANRIIPNAIYREKVNLNESAFLLGLSMQATGKTIDKFEVLIPNPPYTPTAKSFSIIYTALAEKEDTTVIQLQPFDDTYIVLDKGQIANNRLLPIFDNPSHLYLALKDAIPASKHSLLFQFAEYTGNPDLDFPPIKWFYLKDNNAWQEFTKAIDYDDDTEGFAQSGIITFTLPKDAAIEQTILPKGYHWLRASVTENAAAFDRLLAVHAQAAKVTFTPSVESDLKRLSEPLPEKSIKKPVIENAGIAKIEQFYPSVEGSVPEKEAAFYRRVSERLRHKGRAVTIWDYEALVLEAFPQIYKVKCLNHTEILRGGDYDFEIMPTKVAVVVIPNVQKLPQALKDTPKANQNMLGDIHRFLETRLSPFVGLEVLNPRYEPVNVAFNVKFHPDFDVNFYKKQLQEDLKQHLSPWTKAEPAEIQFGGEIYFSSVLKFVEEQPYVDYVTDFTLQGNGSDVGNRVVAKTARSVLSSGSITIGDANC